MQVGLPWRDLPKYFGKHNTVYKAFNRWSANNKLILLFNKVINQPDMEWVFIDGSHIKAYQHIVKELKKYYGVGSPCRTLLYCLRLAALYYFFTSPTIVSNPMTIWTGIYISFGI